MWFGEEKGVWLWFVLQNGVEVAEGKTRGLVKKELCLEDSDFPAINVGNPSL